MFLDIEDLADESDGRARGDGSHSMEGGGEAAIDLAREGPGKVKDGDHGDDQKVAQAGAKLVPMG